MYGLAGDDSSWCDPTDPLWCHLCGNCLQTSAPFSRPPIVQPPPGAYSTGPGPTVNDDPTLILNNQIDQQTSAWKAQVQSDFDHLAAKDSPQPASGYVWAAAIVAGVAAVSLLGGR